MGNHTHCAIRFALLQNNFIKKYHIIIALQTDGMTARKVHERCVSFEKIELTQKMRLELIRGHNGLRNRFAKVLNVSNMKELVWDAELAQMAGNWMQQCLPYQKDECADLKKTSEFF